MRRSVFVSRCLAAGFLGSVIGCGASSTDTPTSQASTSSSAKSADDVTKTFADDAEWSPPDLPTLPAQSSMMSDPLVSLVQGQETTVLQPVDTLPTMQVVPETALQTPPAVNQAIQKQAEAAFRRLLQAAESGRPDDWVTAEAELQQLGSAVLPTLIPPLSGSDPLAREMAVMFLAQLGPDAAPAAVALEGVLSDPSPFVQVNAAALLTTLESPPPAAIETLLELLEHPENNLRVTAVSALGNVPAAAKRVVPALKNCLTDADPHIRLTAATALGRIGQPAVSTLPQLRTLVNDDDPAVKDAALFAIRQLDPELGDQSSTTITTGGTADTAPNLTLP